MLKSLAGSKNADPYPRMPLTCDPPQLLITACWAAGIAAALPATYHSVLSSWHPCSPAPAAIVSCYWLHLILGNTSCLSQHVESLAGSKNADPYPRMPLTCDPPQLLITACWAAGIAAALPATYHSVLSSCHCCGPAPAAIVSCYWSHLILGNTSCLSQRVEKLSWVKECGPYPRMPLTCDHPQPLITVCWVAGITAALPLLP